jgi:hypothetical protein
MDRQEQFLAPVSGWMVTAQDKIYDAMPLYGCVGSYRLWTDGVKVASPLLEHYRLPLHPGVSGVQTNS